MIEDDDNAPATKGDLRALKAEMKAELKAEMKAFEDRVTLSLAGEIARSSQVMMEHMTALFRAGDDRITTVEQRLDEHVSDATVHRAPRARRR